MAVKTTRSTRGILSHIRYLARGLHEAISRKAKGDVAACEVIAHGIRRLNLLDKKLVYAFLDDIKDDIRANNNIAHIRRIRNMLIYLLNDERIALGQHRYLYLGAMETYNLAVQKERILEHQRIGSAVRVNREAARKERLLLKQRILLRRQRELTLRKIRKS